MRRTVRQIGLPAPILELVPESVRGERLAVYGDQECHIAEFARRNARREIGMQRNVDVDRVAMLVLCLLETDAPASDVLAS